MRTETMERQLTPRDLARLQDAVHVATRRLIEAVNQVFPVGTEVRVDTGNGWEYGVVSTEAKLSPDVHYTNARTGSRRRKHFSDVFPVGVR